MDEVKGVVQELGNHFKKFLQKVETAKKEIVDKVDETPRKYETKSVEISEPETTIKITMEVKKSDLERILEILSKNGANVTINIC